MVSSLLNKEKASEWIHGVPFHIDDCRHASSSSIISIESKDSSYLVVVIGAVDPVKTHF